MVTRIPIRNYAGSSFGTISWGLFFTFGFLIGSRNLLTGLGYLLTALAAHRLSPLSHKFGWASALCWLNLAWALMSVWLFDLLTVVEPTSWGDFTEYAIVALPIQCALVWMLLDGVREYTTARGRLELARWAVRLRNTYLICLVPSIASLIISWPESPKGVAALAIIIGLDVFAITWMVMALRLLRRVRSDLASWEELPGADARRPWQFSLRTLLLLPVALWLVLLTCYPKLATGDFCNVHIETLKVHDNGQIDIAYATRTSGGTGHEEVSEPYSSGSGGFGGGPWPHCGHASSSHAIQADGVTPAAKEVRKALLVQEGKTYRVTLGKPLYFYDFKDKKGVRHCRFIKVTPQAGFLF